jgi:hypothetical protein
MTHVHLADYVTAPISISTSAAAVASPFWLPVLRQASETAGLLLPLCGLVLIVVQIRYYYKRR